MTVKGCQTFGRVSKYVSGTFISDKVMPLMNMEAFVSSYLLLALHGFPKYGWSIGITSYDPLIYVPELSLAETIFSETVRHYTTSNSRQETEKSSINFTISMLSSLPRAGRLVYIIYIYIIFPVVVRNVNRT